MEIDEEEQIAYLYVFVSVFLVLYRIGDME